MNSLEERIAALEYTVGNLVGYNKNEIKLIEQEGTESVSKYISENIGLSLMMLRPSPNYITHLTDPCDANNELTELDGVIILSNDPNDIRNKRLNLSIAQNNEENTMYQKFLVDQIQNLDEQINSNKGIVINNIVNLCNSMIPQQTLLRKKSELQNNLRRLKQGVELVEESNIVYKRILIIIETKHKVTCNDVEKKLLQMENIKKFMQHCDAYYAITKDLSNIQTQMSKKKNELRILKRKKSMINSERTLLSKLQAELEALSKTFLIIHANTQKVLLAKSMEMNWTDGFMKFCEYENFHFDDIMLFMGGPLWEKESLKTKLLQEKHHIILQSNSRYIVK